MFRFFSYLFFFVVAILYFTGRISQESLVLVLSIGFVVAGVHGVIFRNVQYTSGYGSRSATGGKAQMIASFWIVLGIAGLSIMIFDVQPIKSHLLGVATTTTQHGPLPALSEPARRSEAMSEYNLSDLTGAPLSRLAKRGLYTVVEVWVDGNPDCRQIERHFEPLLSSRSDVTIQRVELVLDGSMDSDAYGIEYIPHIEIYGPDRQLIAADNQESQEGTALLSRLIKTSVRKSR